MADTARGLEKAVGKEQKETKELHRLGNSAVMAVRHYSMQVAAMILVAGLFILEKHLMAFGADSGVLVGSFIHVPFLLGLAIGAGSVYGLAAYVLVVLESIVAGLEKPHHRTLMLVTHPHSGVVIFCVATLPILLGLAMGAAALTGFLIGAGLTALLVGASCNITGSSFDAVYTARSSSAALKEADIVGDGLKDAVAPVLPTAITAVILISLMASALFV